MRPRQIAPVALVLGLTLAGFIVARALAEQDARRDSEHRAEVAAAQVRGRVAQAASLTESLRRFMQDEGGTGVTSAQFARNALRWLSPAESPAAAWIERVPDAQREAYEHRIRQPIVTAGDEHSVVPAGARSAYLPATLVSGFSPMAVPATDLSGVPGMTGALAQATRTDAVTATPVTRRGTGTSGLFLAAPAPRLITQALHPGYVVVFVPESTLRDAATDAPSARLTAAGAAARTGGDSAREAFTAAGRRFEVAVPEESVEGSAEALPWIILAAGLVLAGLAAALAVNRARRARAQQELDRIFTISSDLIAVADFDGHFTRVNPAVRRILGYSEEEFLARPYLELVHPDDRSKTAAEANAIGRGKRTMSFENRYLHRDGSYRVLDWTSTPVVEEGLMYGVARDVTERRSAEDEVERLADEQAALRRVATLVAEAVPLSEVFSTVTREAGMLLGGEFSGLARFDRDEVLAVAVWAADGPHPPVPPSWRMQEGDPATRIAERMAPTRWDDWTDVPGAIAEFIRGMGIRCSVGCPIVVQGELWGALAVHSKGNSLPPEAESRITQFNDLVAVAVANAQARGEVDRLAQEQAALRRVATLVASNAPQSAVFASIADSVGALLGTEEISMARYEGEHHRLIVASSGRFSEVFPVGSRQELGGENAGSRVRETGRPARIDDYQAATGPIADAGLAIGIRGVVATPILVAGRLWGHMTIGTLSDGRLPPDTESRLGQFTELMATAIANTDARARAERLADEQAALRRVATLVAEGVEPAELFAAVTREVARLFADVDPALVPSVIAFDPGPEFVLVGAAKAELEREVGSRYGPTELFVSTRVLRTGASARVDAAELHDIGGPDAELLRREGFLYQVGSPIILEGRPWGAITINSANALPPDAAERLEKFTELVATAIANTESREALAQLAEEQTALRRVATLAAEGGTPSAVLDAVVAEMETLLDADQVALNRFEPGDEIQVLAHRGLDVERTPVGSRVSTEGESVTATVRRTGRPARIEDYTSVQGALAELARETGLRSSVSAPITVEGQLWGVMTASWKTEGPPPPDTEERMVKFAALLDTAIANAEARTEIERLAEEQAALRRVATLVAEGVSPTEVFDAVVGEVERVLGSDRVSLSRYEPGSEITVLAHRGSGAELVPTGSRLSHEGDNVQEMVRRTERPARMEDFHGADGRIAEVQRTMGVRAVVAAPVIVDGRLWGVIGASWVREESPPAATEERVAQFAQLLETAIANADSRDQLTASRERLVTEGDEARRRVVRDLHDGAQQRLVHTIVTLKLAKRAFREEDGKAESLLSEALKHAEQGNEELRELAHGILPAVLTRGGLRAGIDAVVMRLDFPVRLDITSERFPEEIEASAYFIVAEALTNVVKHSHAEHAEVRASVEDGTLHLEVRDDGTGGADPSGHGLVGMGDRVAALGGRLRIESSAGGGTLVAAALPISGG